MPDSTIIFVKAGPDQRWDVLEQGFDKPISYFDNKDEAVKYARGLAHTKTLAQVKVLEKDGSISSGETYTED
ncbi:MAG: DUF2188 domain-containing protein [Burkholderiales bacterium]